MCKNLSICLDARSQIYGSVSKIKSGYLVQTENVENHKAAEAQHSQVNGDLTR